MTISKAEPSSTMAYEVHTLKQRPDLEKQVVQLNNDAWPEYIHHSDTYHWDDMFSTLADFQVLLCNPSNTVVAVGFTVPLIWDGTLEDLPPSIENVLLRGLDVIENQRTPTTLIPVAAIVPKCNQGQRLSSAILREMGSLSRKHELGPIIIPVRPSLKDRYPLTPIERYAQWTRPDGAPFDPWLRVHWRLGAKQFHVAPSTLTVSGTVSEWEEWTNMEFPDSGSYIVAGGLQPITIDRERNEGYYEEPNIWVKYPVSEVTAT